VIPDVPTLDVDGDLLRALLAGWIAGAAASFAATAIVVAALAQTTAWRARLTQVRVSLPLVGIIVVNGALLVLTIVGLVLGALYHAGDQPGFSLGIAVAGVTLLALGWFVRGRLEWPIWALVGVFVASYGGLLPLLAG
jgi:hypothetical protein